MREPRNREKKIERIKKSKRKKIYFFLATIFLLSAIAYFIASSSILTIERIRVFGNKHNLSSEIMEKSGIKLGQNLFGHSSRQINKELAGLPWVKEASLGYLFFPFGLKITIIERKPAFYLIAADKNSYVIDSDLYVIEKKEALKQNYKIPTIELIQELKIKKNNKISLKQVANAVKLYSLLTPKIKSRVTTIRANEIDDFEFISAQITILFGDTTKISLKNSLIEKLMNEKSQFALIDVRVPSNPAARTLGK